MPPLSTSDHLPVIIQCSIAAKFNPDAVYTKWRIYKMAVCLEGLPQDGQCISSRCLSTLQWYRSKWNVDPMEARLFQRDWIVLYKTHYPKVKYVQSIVRTLVHKGSQAPYSSQKPTLSKSSRFWNSRPLEHLLLSKKQSDISKKTSRTNSLWQTNIHSLWSKVLTIQMVASSKGSVWIKRKCFHLSTTIDGRCGKIVSETNAKADLLNEVFINQNTSLAPDACVFRPSPLNVTLTWGTFVRLTFIDQRVLRSLPNKTSCVTDKISYGMMKEAGQGLVGLLFFLLVYSILHLDYGRFWMNGGKQSLNRLSRDSDSDSDLVI